MNESPLSWLYIAVYVLLLFLSQEHESFWTMIQVRCNKSHSRPLFICEWLQRLSSLYIQRGFKNKEITRECPLLSKLLMMSVLSAWKAMRILVRFIRVFIASIESVSRSGSSGNHAVQSVGQWQTKSLTAIPMKSGLLHPFQSFVELLLRVFVGHWLWEETNSKKLLNNRVTRVVLKYQKRKSTCIARECWSRWPFTQLWSHWLKSSWKPSFSICLTRDLSNPKNNFYCIISLSNWIMLKILKNKRSKGHLPLQCRWSLKWNIPVWFIV